jgi:hypothetical protein
MSSTCALSSSSHRNFSLLSFNKRCKNAKIAQVAFSKSQDTPDDVTGDQARGPPMLQSSSHWIRMTNSRPTMILKRRQLSGNQHNITCTIIRSHFPHFAKSKVGAILDEMLEWHRSTDELEWLVNLFLHATSSEKRFLLIKLRTMGREVLRKTLAKWVDRDERTNVCWQT